MKGHAMGKIKVFNDRNAQAIFIPEELAYAQTDIELEIERIGEELRIRPVKRSLAGALEKFAQFGPDFMAQGRDECEQAERVPPEVKGAGAGD
jgi:antitoxin VapB